MPDTHRNRTAAPPSTRCQFCGGRGGRHFPVETPGFNPDLDELGRLALEEKESGSDSNKAGVNYAMSMLMVALLDAHDQEVIQCAGNRAAAAHRGDFVATLRGGKAIRFRRAIRRKPLGPWLELELSTQSRRTVRVHVDAVLDVRPAAAA